MRYYCFLDTKGVFSPDGLNPIRTDLFALCDEEGHSSWYVPLQNDDEAKEFAQKYQLGDFSLVELEDCVDWGMQWSLSQQEHSLGEKQNPVVPLEYLTIDLKKICKTAGEGVSLKLLPGPGFGDLSHPTTRLSLKMLSPLVKDVALWDIGCGSGILSLAALKLGASAACGMDIDPSALQHARRNAAENGLLERCTFWNPESIQGPIPGSTTEALEIPETAVVVMNMIRSEQEVVWRSFAALSRFKGRLITSGILHTERALYRELCMKRGWTIEEELIEGDWMAFCLRNSN